MADCNMVFMDSARGLVDKSSKVQHACALRTISMIEVQSSPEGFPKRCATQIRSVTQLCVCVFGPPTHRHRLCIGGTL